MPSLKLPTLWIPKLLQFSARRKEEATQPVPTPVAVAPPDQEQLVRVDGQTSVPVDVYTEMVLAGQRAKARGQHVMVETRSVGPGFRGTKREQHLVRRSLCHEASNEQTERPSPVVFAAQPEPMEVKARHSLRVQNVQNRCPPGQRLISAQALGQRS
mmetsp:Transcript_50531/g.134405  ORF Transcript_50531/g.134405 Transcript_50531/m.134405 type:complete len:157 (-) Transcript_50531:263-733(-)